MFELLTFKSAVNVRFELVITAVEIEVWLMLVRLVAFIVLLFVWTCKNAFCYIVPVPDTVRFVVVPF